MPHDTAIRRRPQGAVDWHCFSPTPPEIIQRFLRLSQEPETSNCPSTPISAATHQGTAGSYHYLHAMGERCQQPHSPDASPAGKANASSLPPQKQHATIPATIRTSKGEAALS